MNFDCLVMTADQFNALLPHLAQAEKTKVSNGPFQMALGSLGGVEVFVEIDALAAKARAFALQIAGRRPRLCVSDGP